MERDSRFQSLLLHISRSPNKQVLLIKQDFTFLSKSPVKDPTLHGSSTGSLWRVFRSQMQWFIHSFIQSVIRISQSPQLRSSPTKQGENILSPSTEPHADGRPSYNGVRPGSPRGSFTTLLLLPQSYAGFISRPTYVGIIVDKKGTPIGFLQSLFCSVTCSVTCSHQCFTLQFNSPITSVAQITKGGTVFSRICSIKSPAWGAGNLSEPRLISQVRRVREVVCAYISVFLQSERWRCRYSSAFVDAAVTWLRLEDHKICEIRAEGCHAKWWGLCEYNPAITSNYLSIPGHFMSIQTMRHSPRSR
jgi:hypothetical protein